MDFLVALGGLGLLLLVGLFLRTRVRLLRTLLLPVSVIGGFVGLGLGPYLLDWIPANTVSTWASLPGVLINFVFAALFLGVAIPSPRTLVDLGGPLIRLSAVISLGQYVVALLLTWLVLTPLFGTPHMFASILEVGFAGGHGTAAAMGSVFDDVGFEAGGALGQMSATVGIVVAVVTGLALIQWGVARGHTTQIAPSNGVIEVGETAALLPPDERDPAALHTVRPGALDTFSLHVAVISVAVLIGWLMQIGVRALHPSLAGFPLFPLAMIGGILMQLLAHRTGVTSYFDRATFERIMGLSLDVLIVAAIASLRLDLFLQNVAPFTLLMLAGIVWTLFTFLVLAPRMIRRDWFEQTITEYGTATGVTAIGLMLLRVVDPQNRTTGAQAFAARAFVISPIFGGGLVTATVPLLLLDLGLPRVLAGTAALTLALCFWPTSGRSSGA
ncbi:MAG: hypothetical protein AMS19_04700 [Gemmatimonas sp. SG8_23]|nr:MAG: hypothetical protein AMS19_04700 [Gemmatimonas sp. SG8_23]